MIKVASLFSGIGGFERGFQQAGDMTKIVFSSEIDKYARQIYKKNFGVEPHGDITQINATDIPDHDILCGGFPCQAFSVAGKRRGFEDTRGTLFFEIMRVAEAKRPKLLFLENVKGLLSHDEGRTFQTILRSMDELGYDAEWQVFNSKNHGVPQNRERVFIIGHLRGGGTRPIFPITKSAGQVSQKRDGKHICAGCLSTRNQSGQAQWDGSTTLICDTVTAQDRHGIMTDDTIRRLTPTECERLQGFPDGWTEGISDTQRYKCLGNAVTVNVVEFVARHLLTRTFIYDSDRYTVQENNIMTKEQYLRPKRTIKRGKATYRHHQSFNTLPPADIAAHYATKGTGCDTYIVTEAITKPQSRIEKLVLGTAPVQHVYHVYLAD